MNKTEQVYELLLMPIYCNKKFNEITRRDNQILSGQKYYSSADEDMSDFAIGFYEILYKEILDNSSILNQWGFLQSNEFAGDTMNSFNTIANITPGAGRSRAKRTSFDEWPEYLQEYHKKYHCLANFWILPMDIGRTISGGSNKAKKPISDYMDRFLQMLHDEILFDICDRDYFKRFNSWYDFRNKHFLDESYIVNESEIKMYSNSNIDNTMNFTREALKKMMYRAECIARSKYADELWRYFDKLQLF